MFRTLAGTARWALASVMTLSVASSLVGSGTYAAFVAQTTNPNNTFQAGTLKMTHDKDGLVLFAVQALGYDQPTLIASGTTIGSPSAQVASGTEIKSGPDVGGLVPGSILENVFTLTRTGTLPFPIKLSVTQVDNENDAGASCDASNSGNAGYADTCGTGRLSDALKLLVYYPLSDGYMCIYGDSMKTGTVQAASVGTTSPQEACGWGTITEGTLDASATGTVSAIANGQTTLATPLRTVASEPVFIRHAETATSGAQTVDVLPYGMSHQIHVRVHMPADATNRFQGAKSIIGLKWSSESGPVASGTNGVFVNSPMISSFSPASGTVGTSVTILGSYFDAVTGVDIGYYPASFTVVASGTQINTSVPASATIGSAPISLFTSSGGQVYSSVNFTVVPNSFPSSNVSASLSGSTLTVFFDREVVCTGAASGCDGFVVRDSGNSNASITATSMLRHASIPTQIVIQLPTTGITGPISLSYDALSGQVKDTFNNALQSSSSISVSP